MNPERNISSCIANGLSCSPDSITEDSVILIFPNIPGHYCDGGVALPCPRRVPEVLGGPDFAQGIQLRNVHGTNRFPYSSSRYTVEKVSLIFSGIAEGTPVIRCDVSVVQEASCEQPLSVKKP